MLRDLNGLIGYKIHATDGELGTADEFYFDDTTWEIRYLVVRMGSWLAGRSVLISTAALKRPGWESKSFPVALTREQVRTSPDIDTEKTVTRRHELELHRHYAWPLYWGDSFYAGGMSGSPLFGGPAQGEKTERPAAEEESHLQGTRDVTGYKLHAADGTIGHVKNYIINDETWEIRYLVADTGIWLPGRNVLVSPHWIESVNWETSEIYVDLTREAIKESPAYDPEQPVSDDYESGLYDHYGRPKLYDRAKRAAAGGKR